MYLQPIADRIKRKFSSWKGSLLSITSRVQLIKSVIQSMFLHSFHFYAWHVSLLKIVDKWMINFMWAGNTNTKKILTVAWHKVCKPIVEGGLGIRSIKAINNAGMLKLCWELISLSNEWSCLLRARVFKQNTLVTHHL